MTFIIYLKINKQKTSIAKIAHGSNILLSSRVPLKNWFHHLTYKHCVKSAEDGLFHRNLMQNWGFLVWKNDFNVETGPEKAQNYIV